jgi:hypothetical protein
MDADALTGLLALKRSELSRIETLFTEACERAAFRSKSATASPPRRAKSAWRRYLFEARSIQPRLGTRICEISHEIARLEQRAR